MTKTKRPRNFRAVAAAQTTASTGSAITQSRLRAQAQKTEKTAKKKASAETVCPPDPIIPPEPSAGASVPKTRAPRSTPAPEHAPDPAGAMHKKSNAGSSKKSAAKLTPAISSRKRIRSKAPVADAEPRGAAAQTPSRTDDLQWAIDLIRKKLATLGVAEDGRYTERISALAAWAAARQQALRQRSPQPETGVRDLVDLQLSSALPLAVTYRSAREVPSIPVIDAEAFWRRTALDLARHAGPERFEAMKASGALDVWLDRLISWGMQLSQTMREEGAEPCEMENVSVRMLNAAIRLGEPDQANAEPVAANASVSDHLQNSISLSRSQSSAAAKALHGELFDEIYTRSSNALMTGAPERMANCQRKGLLDLWKPAIRRAGASDFTQRIAHGQDVRQSLEDQSALVTWAIANIPAHLTPTMSRCAALGKSNFLEMLRGSETDIALNSIPKSGTNYFLLFFYNYIVQLNCPDLYPLNYDDIHLRLLHCNLEDLLTGREWVDDPTLDSLRKRIWQGLPYRDFSYTHYYHHLPHNRSPIIFLYRNPLDFLVSVFHHNWPKWPPTVSAPKDIIDEQARLYAEQYRFLMSLAGKRKVMPISYEMLMTHPERTMSLVLRWLGIPVDTKHLSNALKASSRDAVRKMEKKRGQAIHKQRPIEEGSFIRSGKIGEWRAYFDESEVARVRQILANYGIELDSFEGIVATEANTQEA